jgi:hypothetical protein
VQGQYPDDRSGIVLQGKHQQGAVLVTLPATWLNIAFLLLVTVVPFSTDLLGVHGHLTPPVLIYVSCDALSFRRDVTQLASGGRLRLAALEAWSLFPNTEHVETLARFERA